MDIKSDLEFIKKLQEIEEHGRAISLCQYLLGLPPVSSNVSQRATVGDLLAASFSQTNDFDPMWGEEYNGLFEAFLSVGRKKEAAQLLLRRAEIEGDFIKVAELFFHNTDPEILQEVNRAFEAIFEFNTENLKPEVERLCARYINFLMSHPVPIEITEKFLDDYFYLACVDEEKFSSIVLDVLNAIDQESFSLKYLLARCYGASGQYHDALKTALPLLTIAAGADRIYLLSSISNWFLEIDSLKNARIFAQGIIDAPEDDDRKFLIDKAEEIVGASNPKTAANG